MSVITADLESFLVALLSMVLPEDAAESIAARFAGQPEFFLRARPSTEQELEKHMEYIDDEFDRIVGPELRSIDDDTEWIKHEFLKVVQDELEATIVGDDVEIVESPLCDDPAHQLDALEAEEEAVRCSAANIIADSALLYDDLTIRAEVVSRLVDLLADGKTGNTQLAAARALADISRQHVEWAFDYPDTIPSIAIQARAPIQREVLFLNQQMVKVCDSSVENLSTKRKVSVFRIVSTASKCLCNEDANVASRSAKIIDLASQKDIRFVINILNDLYQCQYTSNPIVGEVIDSVIDRLKDADGFDINHALDGEIDQLDVLQSTSLEESVDSHRYQGDYAVIDH